VDLKRFEQDMWQLVSKIGTNRLGGKVFQDIWNTVEIYAQESGIVSRLVLEESKIPGKTSWTISVPDLRVEDARLLVMYADQHWQKLTSVWTFDGQKIFSGTEGAWGSADMTRLLTPGNHTLSTSLQVFGYSRVTIVLAAVTNPSLQGIRVHSNHKSQERESVSTPCYAISELRLPGD
jgi:hypothetical protein